jgi:hypothetical protein
VEDGFLGHSVRGLPFCLGGETPGRLLEAQVMDAWGSGGSMRVYVFMTAPFPGMTVGERSEIDLSYTPTLSSPWDSNQMASEARSRKAAEHGKEIE